MLECYAVSVALTSHRSELQASAGHSGVSMHHAGVSDAESRIQLFSEGYKNSRVSQLMKATCAINEQLDADSTSKKPERLAALAAPPAHASASEIVERNEHSTSFHKFLQRK